MTTIKEASENIQKARREMKLFAETQGREAIGAAFSEFFAQYPQVDHIKWNQYTPHFNDGDVCTFRVNAEDSLFDLDGEEISSYRKPENEAVVDAFDEIFGSIDEDLLEACFGDGVEVTVTANSVTVEDYDHD